jgi:hypothetical protein
MFLVYGLYSTIHLFKGNTESSGGTQNIYISLLSFLVKHNRPANTYKTRKRSQLKITEMIYCYLAVLNQWGSWVLCCTKAIPSSPSIHLSERNHRLALLPTKNTISSAYRAHPSLLFKKWILKRYQPYCYPSSVPTHPAICQSRKERTNLFSVQSMMK